MRVAPTFSRIFHYFAVTVIKIGPIFPFRSRYKRSLIPIFVHSRPFPRSTPHLVAVAYLFRCDRRALKGKGEHMSCLLVPYGWLFMKGAKILDTRRHDALVRHCTVGIQLTIPETRQRFLRHSTVNSDYWGRIAGCGHWGRVAGCSHWGRVAGCSHWGRVAGNVH